MKEWTDGQVLAPLLKPAFTREQLKLYAEASLDRNPIHLNESFAQAAGFPSVIVHGMISMAYLADYLSFTFSESEYRCTRFKVRFKKVQFPGDQLTCQGVIKKVYAASILVTVSTKNQVGEITVEGDATLVPRSV